MRARGTVSPGAASPLGRRRLTRFKKYSTRVVITFRDVESSLPSRRARHIKPRNEPRNENHRRRSTRSGSFTRNLLPRKTANKRGKKKKGGKAAEEQGREGRWAKEKARRKRPRARGNPAGYFCLEPRAPDALRRECIINCESLSPPAPRAPRGPRPVAPATEVNA